MYSFLQDILAALGFLMIAPATDWAVLWQLAPLIMLWVILELYFGNHKSEQLGWNTALGNGIALFWIVAGSMRHIFSDVGTASLTKIIVLSIVLLYAFFIMYVAFRHAFSEKTTYLLSSPTPVLYAGGIVVLYTYDSIALNAAMVGAIVVLFFITLCLAWIIKRTMPSKDYPWG